MSQFFSPISSSTLRPVWEFIPMSEFERPFPPHRETIRQNMSYAWNRIRDRAGLEPQNQRGLYAIPTYLLEWAAPPPSSTQAMLSLDMLLEPWLLETVPFPACQVILDTPGSGIEQVVKDLARRLGWRIIVPPTVEQILAGGDEWLAEVMRPEAGPFVLPRLEKCYLRHYDGFTLINRLLEWIDQTQPRCLLACDSWSWSFLDMAVQAESALSLPLVLAPFDGARLQYWLPSLARRTYRGAFVFRRADNGRLLFPRADSDPEEALRHTIPDSLDYYGDWVNVDYYLKQLAAYCRGMPGVAWAWWRRCLQISGDLNIDMSLQQEAAVDEGYTVWVQPWSQLKLIHIPPRLGTEAFFILHALLLHGEMSLDTMSMLLPFTNNQIRQTLYQLTQLEITNQYNGLWRVTLLGYPVVRQKLESEGYLVDEKF